MATLLLFELHATATARSVFALSASCQVALTKAIFERLHGIVGRGDDPERDTTGGEGHPPRRARLPVALATRGLLFRAMDALEFFAKGHAELVEKHYAQAIEFFDRAIEVEPGNADAWSEKGIALALLGQNEKALECHERAVEIAPQVMGGWTRQTLSTVLTETKSLLRRQIRRSC